MPVNTEQARLPSPLICQNSIDGWSLSRINKASIDPVTLADTHTSLDSMHNCIENHYGTPF